MDLEQQERAEKEAQELKNDLIVKTHARMSQLEREIASRNKRKAELFQTLTKHGVSKEAFKEGRKRLTHEEQYLLELDTEAARIESVLRAAQTGEPSQATVEALNRQAETLAGGEPPAEDDTVEMEGEGDAQPQPAAPEPTAEPIQAEQQPPVNISKNTADKIRAKLAAAPKPAADGIAADTLPMPSGPIFQDKTPHITAAQARTALGLDGDTDLGGAAA